MQVVNSMKNIHKIDEVKNLQRTVFHISAKFENHLHTFTDFGIMKGEYIMIYEDMPVIKSWEELGFTDDYMFKLVLSKHPKLIIRLLEIILQVKVRKIRFKETEKQIKNSYEGHGIRFDLYVEDENNTVYDIEMQTGYYSSVRLAKRMRFYQGAFDVDDLAAGQDYIVLKKSIIIFLCPFKFLDGQRCIYTFQNYCQQDKSILLPDDTTKIIISSRGAITSDTPKALIPILNYMNGRKADSSFTKEIDDAIKLEKNIETERMSYMTYEMKIREFERAGYHQGKREGAFESTLANIKNLMQTTQWSAEEVMNSMKITKTEQKKYLAMLQTT